MNLTTNSSGNQFATCTNNGKIQLWNIKVILVHIHTVYCSYLIEHNFSSQAARCVLNSKVIINLYATLHTLQTTIIYYLVPMTKHLKYGTAGLLNLWLAICFTVTG